MKATHRLIIVAMLACAIGAVLLMKRKDPQADVVATHETIAISQDASKREALPRLVDLGAGKCIPCKLMAPILEELKDAYAEVFEVEFVDVWENPKAGEQYGIRMIPTQIFYDAAGKELFRHEGFFGKDEILAKWKEFGVAGSTEPGE